MVSGRRAPRTRSQLPRASREQAKARSKFRLTLFSDAEGAEDQVEDVVVRGGSRDLVERAESVIEVEQQHLVGNAMVDCRPGVSESGQRIAHQFSMTDGGE